MTSMGKILFAKQDDVHVLKFIGDVRVTLGPTITSFLGKIRDARNLKSIIIDLSESTALDSTTLGLLAKISLQSQKILEVKPTLVSTNEDVNRILHSMGFAQIFVIVDQVMSKCDSLDELPALSVSEYALREQVLEAHRTLMSLNEKNKNTFCDLVDALEEEKHSEDAVFANRRAS